MRVCRDRIVSTHHFTRTSADPDLGDRKRWRDAVTERERKRYEGLFASNRGLLLPPDMPDQISNVVVRDLWLRSRLPLSELETIWNLVVAGEPEQSAIHKTSLNREEFVAH